MGITAIRLEILPSSFLITNEEVKCPAWAVLKGLGPNDNADGIIVPEDTTRKFTFPSILVLPPLVGMAIASATTNAPEELIHVVSAAMQAWDRTSEIKSLHHPQKLPFLVICSSKKGNLGSKRHV